MTADVLGYQLLVVVVALVGGDLARRCSPPCCPGSRSTSSSSSRCSRSRSREPLHLLALLLYLVIAAAREPRRRPGGAPHPRRAARGGGGGGARDRRRRRDPRRRTRCRRWSTRTREAFGLAGVRLLSHGRRGGRRRTASRTRRASADSQRIPVDGPRRRSSSSGRRSCTAELEPPDVALDASSRSSTPRWSTRDWRATATRGCGRSPRPTGCAPRCSPPSATTCAARSRRPPPRSPRCVGATCLSRRRPGGAARDARSDSLGDAGDAGHRPARREPGAGGRARRVARPRRRRRTCCRRRSTSSALGPADVELHDPGRCRRCARTRCCCSACS